MRKAIIIAAAGAAILTAAAACQEPDSGSSTTHHKTTTTHHATAARVITSRAHVTGAGSPERWFLTLHGKRQPVAVTKATFRRCRIGDRFPACAG